MSSFIEYDVLFIINIFSKIELINIPNANKIASINVFLVLTKIFVHSINTLKKHLINIYRKAGVKHRSQLMGMIRPD